MRDEVIPKEKWSFNSEVACSFDDMLSRSIPQYDLMRETVANLASLYVQEGTTVVDIGCSRGEAIRPLVESFGSRCNYLGLEVSKPMIEAARESLPTVEIVEHDLRDGLLPYRSSVTLSILTLQFVPIEYRMGLLQSIYDQLLEGGAFILVEKVLGNTADIDETMVELYLAMKSKNGYTQEQIDRKRLSLEGVLVPVTASWNEDLLRSAGFRQIDCFWRYLNFGGWIAIKN